MPDTKQTIHRHFGVLSNNKARLVCAVVLCITLGAFPAFAQSDTDPIVNEQIGTETAQQSKDAILLEADDVIYAPDEEVVTARGNVQAIQAGSVLLADEVIYYRKEDRVVAQGNVSLTDSNGNVYFGDSAELQDKFKNGIIRGFSALLKDSSRAAANEAQRIDGRKHIMRKGIFTGCRVCAEDGSEDSPTWQIKAVRIVQDKDDLTVSYRGVIFEVKGIPVMYVPYFSHPDPSVKRKSGFLMPTIGTSDQLGTVAQIPYFMALAPNYDLTLTPYLTGNDSTVLKSEWRHKTPFGEYKLRGSITNTKDRTDLNVQTDNRVTRGHIFGEGRFKATTHSAGGFQVQTTNDDTYLRRFDITNEVDLESNAYFERVKKRNYAFISGHYFQGLRLTDDPGLTPYVLPRIKAHFSFNPGRYGRINLDADALVLQRSDGIDSRRVSAGIDWEKTMTTNWGHVLKPFVHLRGDVYQTTDRKLLDPSVKRDEVVTARALPTAGLDMRWPFVRKGRKANMIIEPIVQVIASPVGGNEETISNEDSDTLVFDASSLFLANKFPGLDRWEDGQRINAGVKLGAYTPGGGYANLIFGRNFRFQETDVFGPETGLGGKQSDYVGRLIIEPVHWFSLSQNVRFDSDSFTLKLNEVIARMNWWRLNLYGSYLNVDQINERAELPEREELYFTGTMQLTKYWKTFAATRRNLLDGSPLESNFGVEYVDDCTRFNVTFKRSFFQDRDIRPADTLLFNFVFGGLGGFGSSQ